MFLNEKQNKQNRPSFNCSPAQRLANYHNQKAREEKHKTLFNLRQINTSEVINWRQSLQNFNQTLNNKHNLYSLLITLFQIAEDPFWRNKINHLCTLIQKLHNSCLEQNGNYLREMTRIPDYLNRLCRIFYLNDNTLQKHFKMLIMLYIYYNKSLNILDQNVVAVGLIHAGRSRSENKLSEYLWLISQIQIKREAISKVLKATAEFIHKRQQSNREQALNVLLPTLTIISNYIYFQTSCFVIDQLLENEYFQMVLIFGLKQKEMILASRQALLLVNNILSKSKELALKLMSSAQVMETASAIMCQQQPIFVYLVEMRRQQTHTLM